MINTAAFLGLVIPEGSVGELRALKVPVPGRGNFEATYSGYFDHDHINELISAAKELSDQGAKGVYMTLNPCAPELIARRANRVAMVGKSDPTTSDADIVCRRWLMLDLDPERKSGIAATDEQHEAALETARDITVRLGDAGWPEPVIIDSGNGAYLLYRVDLPTDDAGLVARVLATLKASYGAPGTHVDVTVGNPARIFRIPGTLNRKGENYGAWKWRTAQIVNLPETVQVVPIANLKALAALAPKDDIQKHSASGFGGPFRGKEFDLAEWLVKHNVPAQGPKPMSGGGQVWEIDPCPWNAAHVGGSAFVGMRAGGQLIAGCRHNSCFGKDWHALREIYEPAATRGRTQWEPRFNPDLEPENETPVEDYGLPPMDDVAVATTAEQVPQKPGEATEESPSNKSDLKQLAVVLREIANDTEAGVFKTAQAVFKAVLDLEVVTIAKSEEVEVMWFGDPDREPIIDIPSPWIDGILYPGFTIASGRWKRSSKTRAFITMCYSVTHGIDFCGKPTRPARCMWVQRDMPVGNFIEYSRKLREGGGYPVGAIPFIAEPCDYLKAEDQERLIGVVKKHNIELLFLDSARSVASVEENNNDQVARFVRRFIGDILRDRLNLSVVLIAHPSKYAQSPEARGGGDWQASADSILRFDPQMDGEEVRFVKVSGEGRHPDIKFAFRITEMDAGWRVEEVTEDEQEEVKSTERRKTSEGKILDYLRTVDCPQSTSAIQKGTKVRKEDVTNGLLNLLGRGQVESHDGPRGAKLWGLSERAKAELSRPVPTCSHLFPGTSPQSLDLFPSGGPTPEGGRVPGNGSECVAGTGRHATGQNRPGFDPPTTARRATLVPADVLPWADTDEQGDN